MSEIKLHNDNLDAVTVVPNYFIDHFMTSANGEFVKIYLYLLRCMNSLERSFSVSEAADRFEHTEKDIQRALKYWEKMGLLRLEYGVDKILSGIYFLDINSQKAPEETVEVTIEEIAATAPVINEPKQVKADAPKPFDKMDYTRDQLKVFQEKDDIKELIFITEQYLGRTLTPTDIHTILFWYDRLHFPVDLIEYLIEYCVGKGHKSMQYMDKVALGWSNSNVTSIEDAKQNSYAYSKSHYAVIKALGIKGRNLVSTEISYIDKWTKQYAFTDDIIKEACSRTISSTHQPSFEYTDRILDSWFQANIRHLADIAKLDESYQKSKTPQPQKKPAAPNKFNNFSQRTYDFDSLEKQLLESTGH